MKGLLYQILSQKVVEEEVILKEIWEILFWQNWENFKEPTGQKYLSVVMLSGKICT